MVRIDELRAVSNLLVWLLRSNTWQQYSAGAFASAIVDFMRVVNSAPRVVPAIRLIDPTREFTFLATFDRCSLYMGLMSSLPQGRQGFR